MTHDYTRHGTTSLFAALEVASGKVHGRCYRRHRHLEFIAFLESLARGYPKQELHLICDNYGTHKHPAVKQWLAAHPRFHLHFTPTSASWFNLVERWFALITAQAIRRGSFDSTRRLNRRSCAGSIAGTRMPYRFAGPSPPPTSNVHSPTLLSFTRHNTRYNRDHRGPFIQSLRTLKPSRIRVEKARDRCSAPACASCS